MYTFFVLSEKFNTHLAGLAFARHPHGLYAPIEYVLSMGGKRLRPVLMLMAYNLYRDDCEAIYSPATAIEVYHNYTLLHDDLMDCADIRRGKSTVHKKWDANTAILSGDAMLVLAYRFMAEAPSVFLKELMDLFNNTALEICEGQQLDMEFEHRNDVSVEEYLEMIRLKTAVLLASSLYIGSRLGGASSEDASHLYDFGLNLGIAFQLKDDFLDVYGDAAVFGKNIGGDILCNKKTFLLIHALMHSNASQRKELMSWLGERREEMNGRKIQAVTDLYNQIGVPAACERRIKEYSEKARLSLERVQVSQERKTNLTELMQLMMERQF